ncbi:MAG TPA: aminomethyl-transferring glycine dehydrogenase subunit GcvPB, partial [Desulfobacteraceae bacterium]|nr:aminomethyl-transferring glycine dehydrogenase subunit GcvPB [Desulfobacteraceae bacterium]
TPHGGGGPGSGPVAVVDKLIPFLPVPRVERELDTYKFVTDCPDSIGRMHTFYGHFGVMIKAYAYILTMGAQGLTNASKYAVLNANYIKESLKDTLNLCYDRPCMHECVFNDKKQQEYHITTMDIAKRLLDYGFHPPTVYFPLVVDAAFMVEPTETESKEYIDQFIDAVKAIAKEAAETPEKLQKAPMLTKVTRLDEVTAARKPCLRG